MLLIPEIETVVLLVPRTGTTAVKNAVLAKYPKAILLYRHMEADGVPHGYDRWEKVGVVRDPLVRLWSLCKYLRDMKQEPNWSPGYADRMRATVQMPFHEWILNNATVFTEPYVRGGQVPGFWPKYSILHSLPETRKSQFLTLRPDLGTKVYNYHTYKEFERRLGIEPKVENESTVERMPTMAPGAWWEHMVSTFAWDFAVSAEPTTPESRIARNSR